MQRIAFLPPPPVKATENFGLKLFKHKFLFATLISVSIFALFTTLFAPVAKAATPGINQPTPVPVSGQEQANLNEFYAHYNQIWLQAKMEHRVRSGIVATTKKGDKISQYIIQPNIATTITYPVSDILYTKYTEVVYEPSNGQLPNNGQYSSSGDDYNNASYLDYDFFDLCGPGAADIALFYWPAPPNDMYNISVQDTNYYNNTVTGWTNNRMRGYMTYLAWQTRPASKAESWWSWNGVMYPGSYPSAGMNNYQMAETLNWELSNHNNTTQFYIPTFWNTSSQARFLTDVQDDIVYNGVPVVAEVNAQKLTNWTNYGGDTHHFITIVGYDSAGYYYTDTCAHSTGCGSHNDGTINYVSQSQMWAAITSVPVNASDTALAGDGGWIW